MADPDRKAAGWSESPRAGWAAAADGEFYFWDGTKWAWRADRATGKTVATADVPAGDYAWADGVHQFWDGGSWCAALDSADWGSAAAQQQRNRWIESAGSEQFQRATWSSISGPTSSTNSPRGGWWRNKNGNTSALVPLLVLPAVLFVVALSGVVGLVLLFGSGLDSSGGNSLAAGGTSQGSSGHGSGSTGQGSSSGGGTSRAGQGVVVPDVVGMTGSGARAALTSRGLSTNASSPNCTVARTNPAAGETVAKGSSVSVAEDCSRAAPGPVNPYGNGQTYDNGGGYSFSNPQPGRVENPFGNGQTYNNGGGYSFGGLP